MSSDGPIVSGLLLDDETCLFVDDGDRDRRAKFDCSGITSDANTPRTVTIPDYDSEVPRPLTAKGDLLTYSTGPSVLPLGTDGYILKASSSSTFGIEWAAEASGGTPAASDITQGSGNAIFSTSGVGTSTSLSNIDSTLESSVIISSAAGGIDIDAAATKNIDISGGQIALVSKENTASAISLTTGVGTTETIVVTNTLGEDNAAIALNASAGGITLNAGAATSAPAAGKPITVTRYTEVYEINHSTTTSQTEQNIFTLALPSSEGGHHIKAVFVGLDTTTNNKGASYELTTFFHHNGTALSSKTETKSAFGDVGDISTTTNTNLKYSNSGTTIVVSIIPAVGTAMSWQGTVTVTKAS